MSRALLVVAHPDDECMWFAPLLLNEPDTWTVLCMSVPRRDPIRAWKFYDACDRLGARGEVVPYVEAEPADELETLDLLDDPRFDAYDTLATHNSDGEYGHRHHIDVHRKVASIANGRTVFIPVLGDIKRKGITVDDDKASHALQAYDHVLPYPPLGDVPKWQALLHRYGPIDNRAYDVHR